MGIDHNGELDEIFCALSVGFFAESGIENRLRQALVEWGESLTDRGTEKVGVEKVVEHDWVGVEGFNRIVRVPASGEAYLFVYETKRTIGPWVEEEDGAPELVDEIVRLARSKDENECKELRQRVVDLKDIVERQMRIIAAFVSNENKAMQLLSLESDVLGELMADEASK